MCTSQLYRFVERSTGKISFQSGARMEHLKETGKYDIQPIPCGNCIECRIQKAQEWAFRCCKEAQEYENNVMITLTYNDEHVPRNQVIDEWGEVFESLTLCKRDVQLFMKRLRKHYKDQKIRFYMCGEYGSDKEYKTKKGEKKEGTKRPHYHIILFNLKVDDMKPYKISKTEWTKEENVLYKSETMNKLWDKGFVDLNEVNFETCCYVARYVTKKYKGSDSKEHYEKLGKIPEYTCMSRKPGIGYAFYEKNKDKIENEETFWQRTKKGLKEFKGCRYFDKQIEKEKPELLEQLKQRRIKKSKEHWKDLLEKTGLTKEEYIANLVSKREKSAKFLKRQLV